MKDLKKMKSFLKFDSMVKNKDMAYNRSYILEDNLTLANF